MLRSSFRIFKISLTSLRGVSHAKFPAIKWDSRYFSVQGNKELKPEDKFGTLSNDSSEGFEEECEENTEDSRACIKKIKSLLDEGKYDEAKKSLRRIQENRRAPPTAYSLLLKYNARLGNVKEAFSLYNDYKRRGYKVGRVMYALLFSACARNRRADVAIPVVEKVAQSYLSDRFLNRINFNALIMAYCRHGIISEPLILIEKLQKRGFKFDTQCFNYLLEACCQDRSSGFRYALLIWRYMRTHSIVPNSYTFLAIAKCAEQCCLGDVELIPEFLKSIAQETGDFSKLLLAKKSSNLTINVNDESKSLGGAEEEIKTELPNGSNGDIEFNVNDTNEKGLNSLALASGSGEESLFLNEIETNMPINIEKKKYDGEYINLLSDKPVCGAITGCDFSNRENRFLLLGGMKGFLKVMADFNVKPNRQIFTKLLMLMSGTRDVENIILQLMKQYKVKPDTVFMNVLVRKRIYCRDICSLEESIDLYKRYRLNPSIFTISILALTCRDYESGKKCVAYAKENDIRLNSEALTPLLKNAIRSNDLKYMSLIVNVAKEHDVEASPLFMATLREAAQKAQQLKFRTMAVEETARISESEK